MNWTQHKHRLRTIQKKIIVIILLLSLTTNSLAFTLRQAGDFGEYALPVAAFLATISHYDGEGTIQFAKSISATLLTTWILKPTINRKRPDGGHLSFPSGHAASAFGGAAFLQSRYGWSYGIPSYLYASVVGYSRIKAKRHWTTDVLGAAAIAVGANLIFTTRYRQQIIIAPMGNCEHVGVQAQVTW